MYRTEPPIFRKTAWWTSGQRDFSIPWKKCSLNEQSWKLSLTKTTPFPTPLQMLVITPFTGIISLHFTADFFILTKNSTQILCIKSDGRFLATTSLKEWLIHLLCSLFIDKLEVLKKLSRYLFLEPEICPIRSLSYLNRCLNFKTWGFQGDSMVYWYCYMHFK